MAIPGTPVTDNVHFSLLLGGVGEVFCRMTPTQWAMVYPALSLIPQAEDVMKPCLKVMVLPNGPAYHWDVTSALQTAVSLLESLL